MFLHYLGHAGWLFSENGSRLLCDPWLSPNGAFYSGWFPFPDNQHVECPQQVEAIYISHAHEDHFDPETLKNFSPDTRFIIADFWDPILRNELVSLGFTNIREMAKGDIEHVGTFSVQVFKDEDSGMYHDSCIIVRGRTGTVLNLNDCRLPESATWKAESIDLLLAQFSGANWFPTAYDYPENRARQLARDKRRRGLERIARAAKHSGARFTMPCSGPPVFLDPDLLHHNNVDNSVDNPFPMMDTAVEYLKERGHPTFLAMPGDVLSLGHHTLRLVSRTMPATDVYGARERYLRSYAKRKEEVINRTLSQLTLEPNAGSLLKKEWLRILSSSKVFAAQIKGAVRFELKGVPDGDVLVDCREKSEFAVRDYQGEAVNYWFAVDHRLVADLLRQRYINFEKIFLSMRLNVWRDPDLFNDALFAILVNFDAERLRLAEQAFAHAQETKGNTFEIVHQGICYLVQRHCPHMNADLSVVGEVKEGVLTCTRHAWQFRLSDGTCLNVADRYLEVKTVTPRTSPSDSLSDGQKPSFDNVALAQQTYPSRNR